MSIEVKNITKIYGKQKALDNISFKVETGEIVGFLGPNGAGKSTMMKILTGYIPQTSGNAKVCGLDIVTQSMEVRKLVGYLPESNPLYGDMYVKEYLRFVAGMHKVSGNKTALIDRMIEMTGLGLEQKKQIKMLSKGYKQRVGLAQALIHDPKVLILDEPTSGLDPNQLIDIRNLIRDIGKQKTVMLSTHIMQEVEAVCQRVIIVNRGKLATDKDVANIEEVMEEEYQYFECEFDKPVSIEELKSIAGVTDVKDSGNGFWAIQAKKGNDIRPTLSKWAVSKDITILTMKKSETSLEQVFHKVTRKK
jgi:ABC-2 type transport system ATP-binding protein